MFDIFSVYMASCFYLQKKYRFFKIIIIRIVVELDYLLGRIFCDKKFSKQRNRQIRMTKNN